MKLKKLHIIAPYPRGEAPSQRFRFEQYIPFWEEHGFEIHYHSFHTHKSWNRLYKKGLFLQKFFDLNYNFLRRWILLFRLIGAKHIFMHREMTHLGPPVFEWVLVKVMRKKYTYDFDDAIWIPNYSSANARFQKLKCYWKVPYLIRWASKVSAGNDFLATYARRFNSAVEVIPTTIDTQNQHTARVDHHKKPVVIGWTGTHSTMHYLDFIVPILRKLETEFNFQFKVISNKKPDYELKSLVYQDWKQETEMQDLAVIQIGIMPLVLDAWSEGKCGFKALQYMALGMAPIVSPVGVNTQMIQHGINGFIAETTEEWENGLRILLENETLRMELGQQALKSIQQKWSVEVWKENYLTLMEN
ncbi:glycosyltransferase [Fluviicola chungangensis]|uniref:Glycosyltransferase n=1 Tax=Fluviicola chungangensis TaxID=2597671 RepID=A0A556MJ22_9FLAO|nr:glycosyltransferase [Fluviicola chungangensis]TSJ39866.1 glycosyltransferase [Fluviicola chungangensis]